VSIRCYVWRWCRCGKCKRKHRDVVLCESKEAFDRKEPWSVKCSDCQWPTSTGARETYRNHRIRVAGNDPGR
jgi:hypothetical protein